MVAKSDFGFEATIIKGHSVYLIFVTIIMDCLVGQNLEEGRLGLRVRKLRGH